MAFSRITDSMMNYGFLTSLQGSLSKQYKLQEQMADGKIIHRASDDPVRVIRSLQYRSAVVQNEQFTSNVKDAQSWMEITDKAVNDLSSLMASAKEIVVRAIAPNPEIGYTAAAKELDGIINQMVTVANTKIGDRYVFAGQMDKTQPFERVQLADPQERSNLTLDKVVYYGDNRKISMITQAGDVNPFRDSVNLTGLDVFGRTSPNGTNYAQATTDVFNKLIRIKQELEKTATATPTNSLGGVIDIDGHYTGPSEFQDYAVKIDALRVKAGTAVQSNTNGGTLDFAWAGSANTLPATTDQAEITIDAVGITVPGVTSSGATAAGSLSLQAIGAITPATITNIRTRIDAVQATAGTISKSNALGGDLAMTGNSYSGAMPPPQKIRVNYTAVAANQVTAATYETFNGTTWSAPAAAAVAGGLVTLTGTGIQLTATADAQNAAGDSYTFDFSTTGKVMAISYDTSIDGGTTWAGYTAVSPVPSPASDNSSDPFRFQLGATNIVASITTAATNGANGTLTTTGTSALTTNGQVLRASYRLHDTVTGWSASRVTTLDSASTPTWFSLGTEGFQAKITTEASNAAGNKYTLSSLSTNGEVAAVSYSLDEGDTWVRATPEPVAKSNAAAGDLKIGGYYEGLPAYEDIKATVQAWQVAPSITPSNLTGGNLRVAYAGAAIPAAVTATPPQFRIESVDSTTGRVTSLSYSGDGMSWVPATASSSEGPTVFSLGGNYAGFYVSIDDNTSNTALDTYGTLVPGAALSLGSPALITYTTTPAPDLNSTGVESDPVWSMKDSNGQKGYKLTDGLSAEIADNTNNILSQTYTFRAPPRFDIAYGIEVSIAPSSNNSVKDAYTFHMPQTSEGPDHNPAGSSVGPHLDWLSNKGLADIDESHNQILQSVVEVGTRSSMYEMTANMLDSNSVTLTSILSTNEDLDMAKAIIDMKTAENSYRASLSFGSRILPTSLVDFLR